MKYDDLNFNIRWMLKKDISNISKLEYEYSSNPRSAKDIFNKLDNNSIGFIIENNNEIIGYMIYSHFDRYYTIDRINIVCKYRRLGLGKRLIHNVKNIMTNKINQIRAYVDINDLELQMFFHKCSFEAIKSHVILDREFIIFIFNK